MGRFYEWEDRGMIGALAEPLERGWLQLWCVDSVDDESWYSRHRHPADRARRHLDYEAYLLNEVLPLSVHREQEPQHGLDSGGPRLLVVSTALRLEAGDSTSITADGEGIQRYQCCFHPWMRATVRVVSHKDQ